LLDRARLDDWSLTSLRPKDFPRPKLATGCVAAPDTPLRLNSRREDLRFAAMKRRCSDDAIIPLRPAEVAQVVLSSRQAAHQHCENIPTPLLQFDAAGD
jgi:hypothetical protein